MFLLPRITWFRIVWSRIVILPVFACLSLLVALGVQAQTYASGFADATWEVRSGAFACTLRHQIPGFGVAYFGQQARAAGFFEFRDAKKSFPAGPVRLESIPPVWRNDEVPNTLTTVVAGSTLRLNPEQLKVLVASLIRGTNVVFSGAHTGDELLRVIVDARHFEAKYTLYQRCVTNLIVDTFEQLSRTVIHYSEDAPVLGSATKVQLDKIVRYTKADPKVLGILVDAHSDQRDTPEEAERISQQQAELIASYLIDKGLPATFIMTRWHGNKFPIADNHNKNGQSQNRRITLRLENESTRKDMWRRVAALRAADEKAAAEEAAKALSEIEKQNALEASAITANQLEQLVERQNLNSGKQPEL